MYSVGDHFFLRQMKLWPWIRGCSRLSWRATSLRVRSPWESCTMASSWRPLEEKVWGSSSTVQCVFLSYTVLQNFGWVPLTGLQRSFDCQSWYLWDVILIPLLLTCGFFLQAVCIENSCLIRGSKEGSNGALHLTKTLLRPAEKTMFQILKANGSFK